MKLSVLLILFVVTSDFIVSSSSRRFLEETDHCDTILADADPFH